MWSAQDKGQSRKKTQLMWGEEVPYVGCLQFVFQLIPRPPSKERDGQLWDEPDERTACIVPRFKNQLDYGQIRNKVFASIRAGTLDLKRM